MKRILLLFVIPLFIVVSCKKKDPAETPEVPGTEQPGAAAGLISSSPEFPGDNESFTLTFDAAKGDKGLSGFGGDVYIYAGVITDKSTGPSDWKYVKSPAFNAADPSAKMTPLGNGKYTINISPRSFFGVPGGEKILSIAMLFKNADGSKITRNADGSDIYMPVTPAGTLAVRMSSPEILPHYQPVPAVQVLQIGQNLSVTASASRNARITMTLNGTVFATTESKTSLTGSVALAQPGTQVLTITATDGSATAQASYSFTANGTVVVQELPAGVKDGVTFINGGRSAVFNIYAPGKSYMYVIGEFNDWKPSANTFMKKTPDGNRWWVQIDNLDANAEYAYQYWIDGSLKVADPYSEKVLDPAYDNAITASVYPGLKAYPTGKTTGIVSTMQANQVSYQWTAGSFTRPENKDLVIYELHVRDFLAEHSYKALQDTLSYLKRLGVNAIELMPANEFEGNSSWGYNPSFYFAPDKYYGPKNALKSFIDQAHANGIAVILDMVLNHSFGQSPMVQMYFDSASGKPASLSPWFNVDAKHPFNVGYDFNHESLATKYFSKKVMEFWLKEYKVDGYRFDLSKGFTQTNSGTDVNAWSNYDVSRVAIWKDYNSFIKSVDASAYVILEHFAVDQEEKELADAGMMLWNNINAAFNEATMGYSANSDLSRMFYTRHSFSQPYNLVTYMESHDEERLMYKNLQYGNGAGTYTTKELNTAIERQKMAATLFFASPGPKMIWQFGELGYDVSIDYNGRTGEKPIKWDYKNVSSRKSLYDVYSRLIHWKRNNPIFSTTDFSFTLNGAVKSVILKSPGQNVVTVANTDVINNTVTLTFPASGAWYDNLSGKSINLSGTTYSASYAPGEYHLFSQTPLK